MTAKNPTPTDLHVGYRLRMRRLMLGMSQESLGERLGVSFQQIQKYEKGANRVSASRLQQMASVLQVPVAFFFDDATGADTGEVASRAYTDDFLATKDGLALIKAFMRIRSAALRRSIVRVVEGIAE
jgi:transcriptional regulator with XRE-family HTH domain